MKRRTMTHEIAKDARAAGGALYAAAALDLPVIKCLMVSRAGVEMTVQADEAAPGGFGELTAVARWAAHYDQPVTVALAYDGPGQGWCFVVLPEWQMPIRVETLWGAVTGHQARLLGEALGRNISDDEVELTAAELLDAIAEADCGPDHLTPSAPVQEGQTT